MCVIVTVRAPGAGPDTIRALGDRLDGRLAPFSARADGRSGWQLVAHGCDLIADDADWEADTWTMSAEAVSELASALETMLPALPGELTVQVMWDGDEAVGDVVLSRGDLLRIVRANGIGADTRYRVRAD